MNLRERLKHETTELHEQLETEMSMMGDHYAVEDLKHDLVRFYHFHLAFEAKLRHMNTPLATQYLHERMKSTQLQNDLELLHAGTATPATDEFTFTIESDSELWGALYVIEGSTLGGQVLKKHFSQKWPDLSELKFFAPYGTDTPKKWRSFLGALEQASGDLSHETSVIGAMKVFQSLINSFPNSRLTHHIK